MKTVAGGSHSELWLLPPAGAHPTPQTDSQACRVKGTPFSFYFLLQLRCVTADIQIGEGQFGPADLDAFEAPHTSSFPQKGKGGHQQRGTPSSQTPWQHPGW